MAHPKVTVVREFTYRGAPEEWSNSYYFQGPAPGDSASWTALSNALVAAEMPCFPADVKWNRIYGYTDGDKPAVWSADWQATGTRPVGSFVPGGAEYPTSGDVAGLVSWASDKRNSRGKVVYARRYYHGMYAWANKDDVASNQVTALQTLANKCLDGSISSVFKVCLPDGTACHSPTVHPHLTTRTLKRRGKRPPT